MAKRLLLIRTNLDDFAIKASDSAQLLLDPANPLNVNPNYNPPGWAWKLKREENNNANHDKVEKDLEGGVNGKEPIDFLIHYGHGLQDLLYGQKLKGRNPKKDIIIDTKDASINLLKNKIHLSTVSCLSADTFGEKITDNNSSNAYLGYKYKIAFPDLQVFIDLFNEAYNTPNIALLKGSTFQEAFDAGKTILYETFETIGTYPDSEDKWFAQAAMLLAYNGLTVLGNKTARATG